MAGLWAVTEAVEQEAGLVEAFLQRTTLRMVAMQLAFRGGEAQHVPVAGWQALASMQPALRWQRDACMLWLRHSSGLAGLGDDMPSRGKP